MAYPPQGAGGGAKPQLLTSGTVTSTATDQNILSRTPTSVEVLSGWINISNMQDGDIVVIETKLNDLIHAQEQYEDAPVNAFVYITNRIINAGDTYKITLRQTVGTFRDFDYQIFKES